MSQSWNVHRGINARWDQKQLDAQFREQWGAASEAQDFSPFNDGEARPTRGEQVHPMPYCVYEVGDSVLVAGASGGDSAHIVQIWDIPIQFTIYGKTKSEAVVFAKKVSDAFDRAALVLQDVTLIDMLNDGDTGRRLDDEAWSWIVSFRIRIESTHNGELS